MPRLLHVSDTHLCGVGATTAHPDIDAADRLARAVAAVADEGPFDAVVITGDICDDGSVEAARTVHEIVSRCAPVVLGVPGNHDRGKSVREVFGAAEAWLDGWRIIGADTQVEGAVAGIADAAIAQVDELDDHPTVLLMHHPLRSPSTHPWFTLGGGDLLAERVERHSGPLVVLSGHTHEAFETWLGTAYLLGAPSTYYGLVHTGDTWTYAPERTGVRVVDLGADGLVSTHVVPVG